MIRRIVLLVLILAPAAMEPINAVDGNISTRWASQWSDPQWMDVYSTTTGDGRFDAIVFPAISARYVRMYGTQRNTSFGYSLWEMRVQ